MMKTKSLGILGATLALAILAGSCLTDLPEEKVTVTFDSQGGSEVEKVVLTRGGTLGSGLVAPTKGTDTFMGWFNGFDKFEASTVINTDITLSARWNVAGAGDFAIVTFSSPGAIPPETKVNVRKGKPLGPLFPIDPRMKGSSFEGWKSGTDTFGANSAVTEDVTVTADWSEKAEHTVKLLIPEIHREANPGVHEKEFKVFHGDGINDWEIQIPKELNTAADPNVNQFHKFFMWTDDGTANGLVYNERTPVTGDVTLSGFFGLYFHPKSFDVDLSTMLVETPGAGNIIRSPRVTNPTTNADGSVTVTFPSASSFVWFHTPTDLRPLMDLASVVNETQFRFEVDYEFADPARNTPGNQYNFLIANIRQNDNWNSTEVKGLTLDEINNGIGDLVNEGEIHKVAGTIANFAQNRDWVVIRGGRDIEILNGPITVTFKSIKVHLVQ